MLGLLDSYLAAFETDSINDFIKIHKAYQLLQQVIKYESNKKAYFDAGCHLILWGNLKSEEKSIMVAYPMHLFEAYKQNGGSSLDDETRFGILYPVHKATLEELKELYAIDPMIVLKDKSIADKYYEMKSNSMPTNS